MTTNSPNSSTQGLASGPERDLMAHFPYMMQWAKSQLAHHDAEDVVQETLMAAWRGLSNFEGRSSLKTWLTSILRHKVIDFQRRQRPTASFDEAVQATETKESGPAHRLEIKERWSEVARVLAELPELQRNVFVSREIEGRPTGEVCEIYGISRNNLWVMVHRTRNRLRRGNRSVGAFSELKSAA